METFSALPAICAGNSPMTGEFPTQRPVTRSFDVFFAWINGWVNNREAGDLGHHRAHYDVIVMLKTVYCCLKLLVSFVMEFPFYMAFAFVKLACMDFFAKKVRKNLIMIAFSTNFVTNMQPY